MYLTSDLLSNFADCLISSSNSFLSLEGELSVFNFRDSQQKIKDRSTLFDDLDSDKNPVILFNQDSTEFIINLLACWYGNRPVVPVCLPSKKRLDFVNNVIDQCGSKIYTIDFKHSQVFKIRDNKSSSLSSLAEVTDRSHTLPSNICCKPFYPSNTAIIQFSSGSTGQPKGVLITADNLLSSLQSMACIWDISNSSRFYSWLPLYHDLGLIFGVLLPLIFGGRSFVISSADFAKKPSVWLSNLSKYSITHTAGSTSGYAMASLHEYPPSLSLKSCKFCMIAAEHISASVAQKFINLSGKFGLCSTSLTAAYGLAESTLAVTGDRLNESLYFESFDQEQLNFGKAVPSLDGRLLVSSGYALLDTQISIRDDAGHELSSGLIGEVVIDGPTVMHGYLGHPALSANDHLQTGDLGFTYNNYLFITGRKKELMIINGRNIYPEDVESAIKSSIPELSNCTSVCFSVSDSNQLESVVFVSELERHSNISDFKVIADQINTIILDLCSRNCQDVVFVQRAQLPKTTSGKLQRLKAARIYLDQSFNSIYSSLNDISLAKTKISEEQITDWLKNFEFANQESAMRISRGEVFIALDSLGSSQLKQYILELTGVLLDDTFVWEYDTISKLVNHINMDFN
mgnify:FL=1